MRKFIPFISTIAVIICKINFCFAQVDINDSLALVDLYDSTNGQYWNNHTNWLTASPVSTWYGVAVANGRVTSISFGIPYTNNLVGILPSSIGDLSALIYLNLSGNTLSGKIPSSLGKLSQLTYLDLNTNKLTGKIPASLGNLAQLNTLLLYQNPLTGTIPSALSSLSKLTGLGLHYTQLTGPIPAWIGTLHNLQYLNLSGTTLTGTIPTSLGDLSNLTILALGDDLNDTIPSSLAKLSNLETIELLGDSLKGNFPAWLGTLPKLSFIEIGFTQLSGNIPSSLGNLPNLKILSVVYSKLNGPIPSSLANATTLEHIVLSNNQLSDNIPASLTTLPNLTVLNLHSNFFTFSGLENIVSKFLFTTYAPQADIPIFKSGNTLYVSAGGTASNDTFRLFKDGALNKSQIGDSIFTLNSTGHYNITVTNAIAKKLTLFSDTLLVDSIAPVISIKKNIPLDEGNAGTTPAKFQLLLNKPSTEVIKVNYTTKDGTAQVGSDYVASSGTATIKPGNLSKTVTVNVIGDNTYESNEKFSLVLSNPVNALLGSLDSATCAIKNDDPSSPQQQTNNNTAIAKAAIKLYPNPVRDELNIEGLTGTNATLSIVDMQGRELIKTTANDETKRIDVKKLAPGFYYLRVELNENITFLKFIKQ